MAKKLLLLRTTTATEEDIDISRTNSDRESKVEPNGILSLSIHPSNLSRKYTNNNIINNLSSANSLRINNESSHLTSNNLILCRNPMSIRSFGTFHTVFTSNVSTSLYKSSENQRHESYVNIDLSKGQRKKKNENAKRFRESGRRRRFQLELQYESLLERNQFLRQKYEALLQEKAVLQRVAPEETQQLQT